AAPETRRPDLPPEVGAIVARLMEKNPRHRFQTPEELIHALRPWCQPAEAEGGGAVLADAVTEPEPAVGEPPAEDPPRATDHFADAWQAWVEVLEGFVRGYGNCGRLTQARYAALHAAALESCHVRGRESPAGPRRRIEGLRE